MKWASALEVVSGQDYGASILCDKPYEVLLLPDTIDRLEPLDRLDRSELHSDPLNDPFLSLLLGE
jgi:hypothetical protein